MERKGLVVMICVRRIGGDTQRSASTERARERGREQVVAIVPSEIVVREAHHELRIRDLCMQQQQQQQCYFFLALRNVRNDK